MFRDLVEDAALVPTLAREQHERVERLVLDVDEDRV